MKTTIDTADQFRDQFAQCGRKDQFSYEALGLLFDYFEDVDPDMELDVIAICCDYTEDSAADIFNTYPISCDSETPTDEEVKEAVRDYLQDEGALIGETPTGFVYSSF